MTKGVIVLINLAVEIGEEWEELVEDYLSYFNQSCIAFNDLFNMLHALKEQKLMLGMITNGLTRLQMANIQSLGIKDYLSVILISELEGIKKPDPLYFKEH